MSAAGCDREPQKSENTPSAGQGEVAAKTAILAVIADDEKPVSVADPSLGIGLHPTISAKFQVIFSEQGGGAAYIAEKNGKIYVVHNGKAGRLYQQIGAIALSPDGRRIAYAALDGDKWHMVVDGKMSPGAASYSDGPVFSGDSGKIAYLENTGSGNKRRLVISDIEFIKQSVKEPVVSFTANRYKTRIAAVIEDNGGLRVIEFGFDQPGIVKQGPLYDTIGNLVFGADGSLAYTAEKDGARLVILNGRAETLPDGTLAEPPVVLPGQKAVGAIIITSNSAAFLHQAFAGSGRKGKEYEYAFQLAYNKDGSLYAYAARKGENWFIVVNGKEGPIFDMVVTPVFSPDGKFLVYRARKDGRRFVVVADTDGRTIRRHLAYEQVFQPVFTADGKSIAYGVKDGHRLVWNVEKLGK